MASDHPMTAMERLAALIDATKPRCVRCEAAAVAKISYTQYIGYRPIWAEAHTCLTHFDEVIDELHARGNVIDVKWLDQ